MDDIKRYVRSRRLWLVLILSASGFYLTRYVHKITGMAPQSDLFNQSGSDREIIRRDVRVPFLTGVVNYSGFSPLAYAVFKYDWERVLWLLERGAEVNAVEPDEGFTPLHLAVLSAWVPKGVDILRFLLDWYAYGNARTFEGNTAIHLANSLMDMALKVQVIRELVLNGCDINARNGGMRRSDLHDGYTLMHLASSRHDTQAMDALMAEFNTLIDDRVRDNDGNTAYQYALNVVLSPDMADRVNGEYLKIISPQQYDRNGLYGLHIATMRGDVPWAQLLLQRGADINVRTMPSVGVRNYQYTPLHMAVLYERPEMVGWLLQQGATIARDARGDTPLHIVVRGLDVNTQVKMLDMLLARNPALLNVQNNKGQTIVHLLVLTNNPTLMMYIRQRYNKFLNLQVTDERGMTAAQLASNIGRAGMIRLVQ